MKRLQTFPNLNYRYSGIYSEKCACPENIDSQHMECECFNVSQYMENDSQLMGCFNEIDINDD